MWGNCPKAWVQEEQWFFPFWGKKINYKDLFLCASLSSQLSLVISSCVVCVRVSVVPVFHRRECWKERGFVVGGCNKDDLGEHSEKSLLSPCFNLQTNVGDFTSEQTSPSVPMCKALYLFLVRPHTLAHWLFLDRKQTTTKDVTTLYIVWSC